VRRRVVGRGSGPYTRPVRSPLILPIPTPEPAEASLPPPRTGLPEPLTAEVIDEVVERALAEDARDPSTGRDVGDLTSRHALGPDVRARGRLVSKATGRLAGLDVFCRVIERCDPGARIERLAADGDVLSPQMELCVVEGRARALLLAERTALNLIQRMSGTASLAGRYADVVAAAGSRARILDTRKTTPGLRALEKYAVRCGGAENHRFGLFDEVMVKNNHVDLAERTLVDLLGSIRAAVGPAVRITCEARDEREALDGVAGDADVVMLDNMPVAAMSALCPRLRAAAAERGRPVEIEASGGIGLENLAAVARSGVDRISVGALTHSAPALDLSFYLEPLGSGPLARGAAGGGA